VELIGRWNCSKLARDVKTSPKHALFHGKMFAHPTDAGQGKVLRLARSEARKKPGKNPPPSDWVKEIAHKKRGAGHGEKRQGGGATIVLKKRKKTGQKKLTAMKERRWCIGWGGVKNNFAQEPGRLCWF